VDIYSLVKYLHLLSVVTAMSAATLIHWNHVRVKKAERVPQAMEALGVIQKLAPKMPLFALALFLTGAYLVQNRWGWKQAWVQVGIAGLASILVMGVAVLKPRLGGIARHIAQAGDVPFTGDLRKPLRDPVMWFAGHFQLIMIATVMYLMTMKPGLTGSLLSIGVAVVLAAASAVPMMEKS